MRTDSTILNKETVIKFLLTLLIDSAGSWTYRAPENIFEPNTEDNTNYFALTAFYITPVIGLILSLAASINSTSPPRWSPKNRIPLSTGITASVTFLILFVNNFTDKKIRLKNLLYSYKYLI